MLENIIYYNTIVVIADNIRYDEFGLSAGGSVQAAVKTFF